MNCQHLRWERKEKRVEERKERYPAPRSLPAPGTRRLRSRWWTWTRAKEKRKTEMKRVKKGRTKVTAKRCRRTKRNERAS